MFSTIGTTTGVGTVRWKKFKIEQLYVPRIIDDDTAKAKYDRLQNQIQAQDKKLELELDNIETQRSAVTTEVESVEKVIKDNVESTFKTFA